jgi:hypothetical protein
MYDILGLSLLYASCLRKVLEELYGTLCSCLEKRGSFKCLKEAIEVKDGVTLLKEKLG